jgi:hypothetical protein
MVKTVDAGVPEDPELQAQDTGNIDPEEGQPEPEDDEPPEAIDRELDEEGWYDHPEGEVFKWAVLHLGFSSIT